MASTTIVQVELPTELEELRLPKALDRRLQHLLDRQDGGKPLSESEREEADGLVDVAELLSLLRLKTERVSDSPAEQS